MNQANPHSGRDTCYQCFLPRAVCYCQHIVRIKNRTRIIIAQHPREEFHPLNTARVVERGLENSCRVVAHVNRLTHALSSAGLSSDAAVLYPADDAEMLSDLGSEQLPSEVLVLDGTWHHAKTLLRDVPLISRLRRVRFVPQKPSEYRIRKEPKHEYLSTVEAVHHVLRCIEPDTENLDQLLVTFRAMIDLSMAARRPEGRSVRFVNRGPGRSHRFPELLGVEPRRLVALYCEGTSRFSTIERAAANKEPLFVAAERAFAQVSARRQWVVKTQVAPPERLLKHLALTQRELASAVTPESVRQQLNDWLKPDDVVCVWNQSSAQILHELAVTPASVLNLKGTYCDYVRFLHFAGRDGLSDRDPCAEPPAALGDLDEIICAQGLMQAPTDQGRGARRLTQTSTMLRWLRAALIAQAERLSLLG